MIATSVLGRRLVSGREAGPGVWWKARASSAMSACQYRFVTSLLASTTRPVALVTFCLVAVTLLRLGDAASRITGVPRPCGKEMLLIGEVFSKIVPGDPENGHTLSGAVAKTWRIPCSESSTRTGRVWQSLIRPNA